MKTKRVILPSIPLKVRGSKLAFLLQHPTYRRIDSVHLREEAIAYVGRLIPVPSREVAIALLLSRPPGMEHK